MSIRITSELRAWQVDDCCTYSGKDAEEAIRAAMADTGHSRRDYDHDNIKEVSRDTIVRTDDGSPDETTVGAILDEMDGPGFVCTTEY